jgi:hypothetical protein
MCLIISLDKRSAALSQFVFHRGLIIAVIQAVFCSIFYFAPIALYQVSLCFVNHFPHRFESAESLVCFRDFY